MFLRFTPLALIRASQHDQAVQNRRRSRPDRRRSDRTRTRFRLEGLEDRCLLSGISGITEFPLPSGSRPRSCGITAGPDGNLWFTDAGANAIGMINPTTHAISRVHRPHRQCRTLRRSRRAPTATSGSPSARAGKIGMINPTTHAISRIHRSRRR